MKTGIRNNLSPTKIETMEPYHVLTQNLIPGQTDREKYNALREIIELANAIAFPRRGTWEETATLQDFSDKFAEALRKNEQPTNP